MTWAHAITGGFLFATLSVLLGIILIAVIQWLTDEHPEVLTFILLLGGFVFVAMVIAKVLHG